MGELEWDLSKVGDRTINLIKSYKKTNEKLDVTSAELPSAWTLPLGIYTLPRDIFKICFNGANLVSGFMAGVGIRDDTRVVVVSRVDQVRRVLN